MLLISLMSLALAQTSPPQEKTAFQQALEQSPLVTEERWVYVDGQRYRQITFQNKDYYLKFHGPELQSADVNCGSFSQSAKPPLAEGGVQAFRRTRLFVELLRESCTEDKSLRGGRRTIALDPRIGFTLPESPNSTIKNKKVFISPLWHGGGFYGEW